MQALDLCGVSIDFIGGIVMDAEVGTGPRWRGLYGVECDSGWLDFFGLYLKRSRKVYISIKR